MSDAPLPPTGPIIANGTRVKLALQSWKLTMGYAVLMMAIKTVHLINPDWIGNIDFSPTAFLALATPAFAYMGLESFDLWKGKK